MKQFHVNFKKKDNDTQFFYIYIYIYLYPKNWIFGGIESFKVTFFVIANYHFPNFPQTWIYKKIWVINDNLNIYHNNSSKI
jgi:hypothetical protein